MGNPPGKTGHCLTARAHPATAVREQDRPGAALDTSPGVSWSSSTAKAGSGHHPVGENQIRPGEGNQGQTQPWVARSLYISVSSYFYWEVFFWIDLFASALIPTMLSNHYYLVPFSEWNYLERHSPESHWMFSDCHWLSCSSCQGRISSKLNFLSSQHCSTAQRLSSILLFFTCNMYVDLG